MSKVCLDLGKQVRHGLGIGDVGGDREDLDVGVDGLDTGLDAG
jgi:hypothetical protein